MNRRTATEATGAGFAKIIGTPPASVLTGGEVTFATGAGVPADVFYGDARAARGPQRAVHGSQDAVADEPRFTTSQIAERLDRRPSSVRRLLARGELYAAGRIGRQTSYPAWQFTRSGVLPHLRQVIAALPSSYHPRDVLVVMTSPMEELNGRSPRAWLEAGCEPAPLLELLRELSL